MSASNMESIPLLSSSKFNDISSHQGISKNKNKIILIVTIFILITCSALFIYNYKKSLVYNSIYLSQSAEVNYCKTSCTNSCSSYESIYGNLCCDWIKDSNGGQSCSLQVSSTGTCLCSNDLTNTVLIPIQTPTIPPPPSIATTTIETNPTLKPHKNKNDDDFGFMPWIPWDPIEIPVDGTPCLKQCKKPCGESQSNNKYYCCEMNSKGTCSTTQINGKCYCN